MQRGAKRAMDVAASGVLLVLASPVLLAAAAAVALTDGFPVIFRQRRTGHAGREFDVLKFRSMRPDVPPPEQVGQVHADHEMVTRVGRLLRRLKVDELPQLVNVLRGDMSLVGPRPALPSLVREYDALQRRRLEVAPGMTGWAQVHGNTQVSWDVRIALDVWYVDHWSLALDLRILFNTIRVVLRGEHPAPDAIQRALEHAHSAGGRGGEHAGGA